MRKQFDGLFFSMNWKACLWRELYQSSYRLLCKSNKKKIIKFSGLVAKLNLGWKKNEQVVVFYYKPAFMALMKLIKTEGYIYDYKVVPSNLILAGLKPKILLTKYFASLLIIFIHTPVTGVKKKITLVSKPSRPLFLTHAKLILISQKTINSETLYVLNTTQGLVTLNAAVQQQLGGCLLCRIN